MSGLHDQWAAGSSYDDFMGRWSRHLAPGFVAWLREPAGVHWLDVGCGTGAMTRAICSHAEPASVLGCDPAESFVEYARRHHQDQQAAFVTAGVGNLPGRPDGYGSITSLLALNFFPDPGAALREMRSLAATAGTISACVWDYGEKMEFLRIFWDAAVALDPAARRLDEGVRFPLCRPDALVALFQAAGLDGVRCEPLEIRTEFSGFADYWRPLMGCTGPAPSYLASLDAGQRSALAARVERVLPRGAGDRIVLTARAWAVRGAVP